MPKLHVILASTRPGRTGAAIADWFMAHARTHPGFDTTLVDLTDVNLPFLDEPAHPSQRLYTHDHTRRWSALVDEADAFVFVMPEYNNGITAPLKNALDFVFHEWADKPVAFVSYGGIASGTRAVQMTKQVVLALRMHPVPEAVTINLRDVIRDGAVHPTEQMDQTAGTMLDALLGLTKVWEAHRRRAPVGA